MDVFLVFLFLTLNLFHTSFKCFYSWLGANKQLVESPEALETISARCCILETSHFFGQQTILLVSIWIAALGWNDLKYMGQSMVESTVRFETGTSRYWLNQYNSILLCWMRHSLHAFPRKYCSHMKSLSCSRGVSDYRQIIVCRKFVKLMFIGISNYSRREKLVYCISSNQRPRRLLNSETLRCGAY